MESETFARLATFVGLFALFALLERIAPRRRLKVSRRPRWGTNWVMVGLDTAALIGLRYLSAAFVPLLAVGAALHAEARGWGVLNAITLPAWIEIILVLLIFDLAVWAQHLASHKVPLLWRVHRVHHSDLDMDITTALRFHPLEIALSMLFKVALVYLLGPSAYAVLLFEIMLNGTAMFNHSNLRLPLGLDRLVRLVLVTPDMHRVHHSVKRSEHDSNYGFALSVWDRLFRTYVAQPGVAHQKMAIGLQWQDERPARLLWSLLLPFRRK